MHSSVVDKNLIPDVAYYFLNHSIILIKTLVNLILISKM
jgi:hypothetical protein